MININKPCNCCHGSGKVSRTIKIGDIVTPNDGSSMCMDLHRILRAGTGRPFKPVRVVAIEGDMLGVIPVHWDDKDLRHKEIFGEGGVYESKCHIWKGHESDTFKLITEYGFWIHAHVSNIQ